MNDNKMNNEKFENNGLGAESTNQSESYTYSTIKTEIDENNKGYSVNSSPNNNNKKEGRYGIGTLILCIVLSTIISATTVFVAFNSFVDNNNETNDTSSTVSAGGEQTGQQGGSNTTITVEGTAESIVEAVYYKSANSVVGIRTRASVESFFGGSAEDTSEGSGVIYTSDGYIITNYHVVESAMKYSATVSSIEVFLNDDPNTPIDAKLVGYNASADLAVIKIDKTGLPVIELGNSEEVKVGQYAVAIGCPGGIEFMGSVSYGIISGLNRTITIDSIGSMELIQTDAAINPGNSGGALLNSNGQLIGINSSKLIDESFEGMGFAIPVNTVTQVVKEIIENKDHPSPYIGIDIYMYDSKYLEKYSLPHGAAVKSVVKGAPAHAAGIRAGDIITHFNKVEIGEYTDYFDELGKCVPGTKVTVKIYRNGKYYATTVTIGSNNSYN